eukprot:COSAG01_NODE_10887_length_2060_cov_2.668027_2_plen_97_part_00
MRLGPERSSSSTTSPATHTPHRGELVSAPSLTIDFLSTRQRDGRAGGCWLVCWLPSGATAVEEREVGAAGAFSLSAPAPPLSARRLTLVKKLERVA